MKFFILGIFIIITIAALSDAMADDPHRSIVIEESNNYYTSNGDNYGIASAISASQCHFDNGSFHLQLCAGAGYSDNQEAATFGIAKKYKDFLINGTITTEDNHTTFGFGLNWKVK